MAFAPFDLTGKVALVTGGNRGIGLGMAQSLGEAGARVAIWGRGSEANEAAVATLKKAGAEARGYKVDVADEGQVEAAMAQTLKDFGRVDSVFANAGIGRGGTPFIETTTQSYREVLGVNLDGVFFTMRAACRHMSARAEAGDPGGSLVGVASLAAIEGAARNEAYAATKGAVLSMMRGLAVEFARHGVRANTILPGWIATDMTAYMQGSAAIADKVIKRVPIRRWGEPRDFAGIAVYLASDASAFHTGDQFVIDGGYAIF
ncbi:MAG: SDR family NAD(P)-dependent oxidoreductase [Hyphomonadaceae bacterium]